MHCEISQLSLSQNILLIHSFTGAKVLAIALQSQQEIKLGPIQAEDMFQLSKLCLEFAEWRRSPTRRVVQTLFLSSMYMNNDNDSKLGVFFCL